MDEDEGNTQRVRVTFFEFLVNSFKCGFFCRRDKLYNYFVGPNDEVEINKA